MTVGIGGSSFGAGPLGGATSHDAVVASALDSDLRLVRFYYCDLGGMLRGKATHVAGLANRLGEGIALTRAQMAMNALDQLQPIPEMTAVGEVRIVPDPASFVVLPYAPRTGAMMSDLLDLERRPWDACPRSFLKRALKKLAADGIRAEAAFEVEFFLARQADNGYQPVDQSLCFSAAGMNSTAAFTDDLISALEAQGIPLEQAMPEYGPGQQEISVSHGPALTAADRQLWVKETAKAVAARHGLAASFAPKPWPDLVGSGAHIHLSLWDNADGSNLFHEPTADYGLSETGRRFVAGILAHLPALAALTCPTVNSYRRLQPHAWAAAFVCWGYDNREAAVRVPSPFWGREQGTSNIELKTVDNACNPYLALGALLAAGLDGIARSLDPGAPLDVDPGNLADADREARGLRRLPGSLDEAHPPLGSRRLPGPGRGVRVREPFREVLVAGMEHRIRGVRNPALTRRSPSRAKHGRP
jgi:glutamine synthetase